ncbi:ubiquitin carboxyl-terminal hydrolase [Hyaloraphidium curvatum]|nr:ubiquitin carboxyl-terminal hydrolase [Hyaloraphidium curvatum]
MTCSIADPGAPAAREAVVPVGTFSNGSRGTEEDATEALLRLASGHEQDPPSDSVPQLPETADMDVDVAEPSACTPGEARSSPAPKPHKPQEAHPAFSKSGIPLRSFPWPTVDSDPGSFHNMLRDAGVRGIEILEVLDTDEWAWESFRDRILGLILCFKFNDVVGAADKDSTPAPPHLFFSNQVVPNACATHGLINIVMNLAHESNVSVGEMLENFKRFSADFSSQMKGLLISNSEELHHIHTNYGRPSEILAIRKQTYENERQKEEDDGIDYDFEDAYHFIAYVGVRPDGLSDSLEVWKLDGLQVNPVLVATLGSRGKDKWLEKAMADIRKVMKSSSDVACSLLAVCLDRLPYLAEVRSATAKLKSAMEEWLAAHSDAQRAVVVDSVTDSASLWESTDFNDVVKVTPLLEQLEKLGSERKHAVEVALERVKQSHQFATREVESAWETRHGWEAEGIDRNQDFAPFLDGYFRELARLGLLEAVMEGWLDPNQPEQLDWARQQIASHGRIAEELPDALRTSEQRTFVGIAGAKKAGGKRKAKK